MIKERVDSHLSYNINKIIAVLIIEINNASIACSTKLHFLTLNRYYNCLDQLYITISPILIEKTQEKIIKIKDEYDKCLDALSHKRNQTVDNLREMYKIAKLYNFYLIKGMQDKQFLYRTGVVNPKGLNAFSNIEETIFTKNKNKDKDEVNQGMDF